jgi:hypothetical protein
VQSHSIDSFITDSANSASALYSGHKSTVNAMGVYADSSPDLFDDPKVETIVELLTRIWVRMPHTDPHLCCCVNSTEDSTCRIRSRPVPWKLADHE